MSSLKPADDAKLKARLANMSDAQLEKALRGAAKYASDDEYRKGAMRHVAKVTRRGEENIEERADKAAIILLEALVNEDNRRHGRKVQ